MKIEEGKLYTTVYLIRHSKKLEPEFLNNKNNNEYYQNRREKIILSCEGEKRAEILSKQDEFKDIDVIYSSNYARSLQTAKYFAESKNLVINVDERFNERKVGILPKNSDALFRQYEDENLKNPEGESRKETTDRMYEGFLSAIHNNKAKKIAIFTHGASSTFLLMKWCKLEYTDMTKRKCLSFKNKIIVDKVFDAPEVFKITVDENDVIIDIQNLEFDYDN